jgi:hypothetical protein
MLNKCLVLFCLCLWRHGSYDRILPGYRVVVLKNKGLFTRTVVFVSLRVAWRRATAIYTRDARWFIFMPKIPIWVYFGGSWNGKCWYILWQFGIFYDLLLSLMVGNLVLLCSFGIFSRFGRRKIWQPWFTQTGLLLTYAIRESVASRKYPIMN